MSRRTKFTFLLFAILFLLACNTVTQPVKDVQNLAGTAQSFATAMPMETLKAVASEIPMSTLEALPSAMPDVQAMMNPQGTPVSEWQGVPVMSQATAGQEFPDSKSYSFKVNATVKEVQDYYNTELPKQGWSSSLSMPMGDNASLQSFEKDNSGLTVTTVNINGSIVVILTME
jgi:hypothetical protein